MARVLLPEERSDTTMGRRSGNPSRFKSPTRIGIGMGGEKVWSYSSKDVGPFGKIEENGMVTNACPEGK